MEIHFHMPHRVAHIRSHCACTLVDITLSLCLAVLLRVPRLTQRGCFLGNMDISPKDVVFEKGSLEGLILGGRFRLERKIGEGSFGTVYIAHEFNPRKGSYNGPTVAVKAEALSTPHPQLHFESRVIRHLWVNSSDDAPVVGIPSHYYFGEQNGNSFMAIELLGLDWPLASTFCAAL